MCTLCYAIVTEKDIHQPSRSLPTHSLKHHIILHSTFLFPHMCKTSKAACVTQCPFWFEHWFQLFKVCSHFVFMIKETQLVFNVVS